MPEVVPFRGWRYDRRRFRLADVVAPPYDVISPKERDVLYRKNACNFVRVDLKKPEKGRDVYAEAARELAAWIRKGVVVKEDRPSFYVYVQSYRNLEGRPARRVGFISLMRIDPKKVKKHEVTLDGPKEDRTKLLRRLRANLSPIFGFFDDPSGRVHRGLLAAARGRRAADVRIAGVRHELFVESDPRRVRLIAEALKDKPMYIADGHHRFEVSERYYEEQKREHGPDAANAAFVMTYLCPGSPNDITVYPTHRALSLAPGWEKALERILRDRFVARPARGLGPLLASLGRRGRSRRIGLGRRGGRGEAAQFFILTPKGKKSDPEVMLADGLLIRPLLRGEEVRSSNRICYTRDASEAAGWLRRKEADIALFIPEMPVRDIIRVSDRGMHLPQKSTYFYPKLLSGLVFHVFGPRPKETGRGPRPGVVRCKRFLPVARRSELC